jgi:hypothetical protein
MISEYDLREKMLAVLANRLSIVDFSRWIMSNSWNMQADSSASAVSLASEIHALLAERDNFSLNDSDFIHELRNLYGNAAIYAEIMEDAQQPIWSFRGSQVPLILAPIKVSL